MSNELQNKILELISSAEGTLPALAKEYLAWKLHANLLWLGVGVLFLIAAVITFKKYKEELEDNVCAFVALFVFSNIGIIFTVIGACEVYKIKQAPKIYLIDAFKDVR